MYTPKDHSIEVRRKLENLFCRAHLAAPQYAHPQIQVPAIASKRLISSRTPHRQSTMSDSSASTKESLNSVEEKMLAFSTTVESTLNDIFPSDDPLDSATFDPIGFINQNFPNERSLSRMDQYLRLTEEKIATIDDEIFSAIIAQAAAGKQADDEVAEVKVAIRDLFQKIKDIKEKAEESEVMVNEISRDIKKLDYAKRHLTTTITGLKRLHMLVTAVDQLEFMAQRREYAEAANLLNAVNELSKHFEQYTGVPKVDEMRKAVIDTRRALKGQVLQDFRDIQPASTDSGGVSGYDGDSLGDLDNPDYGDSTQDHNQLHDACLVVDALGGDMRERVMERFCSDQLGVYDGIFRQGGGEDTLVAVERRYHWWRRTLRKYEKSFADVFPVNWEMDRELCMDFARRTRRHIEIILRSIDPPESADVEALLSALRKTLQFEREAAQMFDTNRGYDDGKAGNSGNEQRNSQHSSGSGNHFEYSGGIGGASVSTDDDREALYDDEGNIVDPDSATGIRLRYRRKQTEEKRKEAMKRKQKNKDGVFAGDDRQTNSVNEEQTAPRVSFHGAISTCFGNYMSAYVNLERRNMDDKLKEMITQEDVDEDIKALGSSYHLFGYMHNSIKRCCNYTTGQAFFDLQNEYKKVLEAYANILTSKLPRPATSAASGEATYSLGELGSKSDATLRLACYIVNTADYCAENIPKLEDNIKTRIDEAFEDDIDMESQQDGMYDVINTAIRVLASGLCSQAVSKLEGGMLKTNWFSHSDVGDASPFVQEICTIVESAALICKNILSDEYFQSFCASFATAFLPQFVNALHKCKRIGDVGAQQLLLDTYGVKTLFLGLRKVGEEDEDTGSQRLDPYTKRVLREVSKAESLLKVSLSCQCHFTLIFVALLVHSSILTFFHLYVVDKIQSLWAIHPKHLLKDFRCCGHQVA